MDRRVSTRDLRFGSGLVLFTYLTVHLATHALGLVSVEAAERGLAVAVAIWHSIPGTLLLYGAAAIHLALALVAIHERRTLRMPPLEAARIAFGFGMPLLLIGHFVTTRVGFDLYGLHADYHRIVLALWNSGREGRQLALLAPGWLHGCLGLNRAFRTRRFYRRWRPALFAVAVLLPVLAAMGFLGMLREFAAMGESRAWLDAQVSATNPDQQIALAHIQDVLLAMYLGAIGAVLVARALRVQRRRPLHTNKSSRAGV